MFKTHLKYSHGDVAKFVADVSLGFRGTAWAGCLDMHCVEMVVKFLELHNIT